MPKITKEEILRLAFLSRLTIDEDEIESLRQQLQDVLSYAHRVNEIAGDIKEVSTKNINVMREDVSTQFDGEKILDQAPDQESNFFVVPKILSKK